MELKGRATDPWGNVLFDSEGLIDLLMRGSEFSNELQAIASSSVNRYNDLCKELDHPEDQVDIYEEPTVSVEEWDKVFQEQWFTPEPFSTLDVKEWLLEKCETEEQVLRVLDEWQLFEDRDMIPVLQFLIYMVDNFRKRKVVWGVGRGSSVASYCLYLIGVHKVDSLAYGLDVREFLK